MLLIIGSSYVNCIPYGNRGSMFKWIESYLTGRSQHVIFDFKVSETHSIKCGVPQESILGPLLFILSNNDICNVSPILFTILYADDACVLILYCIMKPYTEGPIGPPSYRHSSGVVRNPHSALAE